MRIDAIDIYHVAMPLLYPWRTAYGEDAAIEAVLVRMESAGQSAWSEVSPLAAPCYSPEWAGGVFACVRDWMAPALIGQEIASGDALQERLALFKGNPFAKAALDIAWWVLDALARGEPLRRRLQGQGSRVKGQGSRGEGQAPDVGTLDPRPSTLDTVVAVDVGADFGIMDSVEDLLAAIRQAVEAGFKRVKLKFRPGWDVPMLRAVRREFPTQTFHIDCNSGYRLADLDLFRQVDEFNLAMIEQPLAHDDLVDHAKLQQAIRTPVCLDESITSLERARQAIELGSCRYVNIKTGRVGGLTPAAQIHDACRDAGIPCWVGSMLESAVGTRINAALATLPNFTYPADLFPTSRFYTRDLGQPAVELVRGPDGSPQIATLDEPGIGTEPDSEMLEKCCVARAQVRATAPPQG